MERLSLSCLFLFLPQIILADTAAPVCAPARWSDCPIGTEVEYRSEKSMDERVYDRWTEISRVVRRDRKKTVLSIKIVSDDLRWKHESEEEHLVNPSRADIRSGFGPEKNLRKVGEETLTLAGRSIACSVLENSEGGKSGRFWLALDSSRLPIEIVKSVIRKGEAVYEEVLTSWNDRISVSGRELRALQMKYSYTSDDFSVTSLTWLTRDVPGHMVRFHSVVKHGKIIHSQITQVVRFGPK